MNSLHPLAEWVSSHGDQASLAAAAGCSRPHLCLILQGKRRPSLSLAQRLSRATGGAITIDALADQREPA